ncbi:MAG: VWA domain-containing protein [Xanthomonadales bacterium]|nr:VWA domain-containing protein [Xanthomonadales bacterium]
MNRLLGVCLFALALVCPPTARCAEAPLLLVLDGSGSMWGQVGGEAKIVGARRVVNELASGLDDATSLGLIAYGHRREGDCNDIEALLPLAALDRDALRKAVNQITPKGKTPITAALQRSLELAPVNATVVLVTDGLETCGGDPCAAVKTAKAKGSEFVLHVIGLDVGSEDVSSLECAAQAGGGLYLPAKDAAELAHALQAAVAMPSNAPAGALVVEARRNGALQDVALRIQPEDGAIDIVARTYATSATNPRTIPLADGRYAVQATAIGLAESAPRRFAVEIRGGERVPKLLDYSTGELFVGATRNGALTDVRYQVFNAGDRLDAVAAGRTYDHASHNPARVVLAAGHYDVVMDGLDLADKPRHEQRDVVVSAQGRSESAHDFAAGTLQLGAQRGDHLADATIQIERDGKAVTAGRTYQSAASNPKSFVLSPGDYQVRITEIRGEARRLAIRIDAGQTQTHSIDFAIAEQKAGE